MIDKVIQKYIGEQNEVCPVCGKKMIRARTRTRGGAKGDGGYCHGHSMWHPKNKERVFPSLKEGYKEDLAALRSADKQIQKTLFGHYPELDRIAKELARSVAIDINNKTHGVVSDMPYKAQYVLEKLIRLLQEKV